MKLRLFKAISKKTWQDLKINLDQDQKKVRKKRNTYEDVTALYEGRELTTNAFKSGIFPIKARKDKGLKVLTPKQMLHRLSITLAQVKANNTS